MSRQAKSQDSVDNPYERYDIDPRDGPDAITTRMRALAGEAEGDERDRLRAEWERLTLHPERRLAAALDAFADTRRPRAQPPDARGIGEAVLPPLTLDDLLAPPSVAEALDPHDHDTIDVLPPLDHDPLLQGQT
jgi:hypothetical protein